MALKRPTNEQIAEELLQIIKPEGTNWQTILDQIGAKYAIKNWLTQVRGPLQWLIDHGLVRRDNSDVRKEVYILTATPVQIANPFV
jgi:hypothetical protein